MMEEWRAVKGYEGIYEVSSYGRVKRLLKSTEKLKVLSNGSRGYKILKLYRDGKCDCRLVHRLVIEAFIPNPDNKPQVNHIDGVKTNNHVSNLEWCTRDENMEHARENGLLKDQSGESNPNCKLSDGDVEKIRALNGLLSQKKIAGVFKVHPGTISGIIRRTKRTSNKNYEK